MSEDTTRAIRFDAGQAKIEDGKATVEIDRETVSEAYRKLEGTLGELPLSADDFEKRVRRQARRAADDEAKERSKRRKPRIPDLRIYRVIIITTYFYLDGVLVMSVSAVVVESGGGRR